MRYKLFLLVFFLSFLSTACLADEISIKAEVDKTKLTADETLRYRITVESGLKEIAAPEVADFKGFTVASQLQSSSVSVVKGVVKTTAAYTFILIPLETGKLTIEPSTIKVGQKIYSTQPFEIEVTGVPPGLDSKQPKTTL